ncbi:MAG TPA: NUDIX hydrolase [Azospirillaceae bacterium]|nr:NUDIX hydrolase [Azospirillaceae bacterium]
MPHEYPDHPRVGVGVIVRRGDAVLLVRRGKPPGLGEWSLPGGSQELGETLFETAAREALEETGVTVRPVSVLTGVDNIERDADGRVRFHYTIIDVLADWVSGEPVPGDDATAARWAAPEEWRALVTWPPLLEVLEMALRAER